MAVVRKFRVSQQGQQRWQDENIEGEIIPLDLKGELFLQIYTLGSSTRVEMGRRSQNLRIDKEAFLQLVEIGRKHFDLDA